LLDTVIDGTSIIEPVLKKIGILQSENLVTLKGFVGKIALILLTLLTVGGLSLAGAGRYVEARTTKMVLGFVFND
jgi:hypothetical protein